VLTLALALLVPALLQPVLLQPAREQLQGGHPQWRQRLRQALELLRLLAAISQALPL